MADGAGTDDARMEVAWEDDAARDDEARDDAARDDAAGDDAGANNAEADEAEADEAGKENSKLEDSRNEGAEIDGAGIVDAAIVDVKIEALVDEVVTRFAAESPQENGFGERGKVLRAEGDAARAVKKLTGSLAEFSATEETRRWGVRN